MEPNRLLYPGLAIEAPQPQNALAPPPTWADAYDYNARAYTDWVARERAKGVELGTIDPQTGWPTKAGYLDAVQQYGNALLLGTGAPGGRFGLERIHPRTLRPLAQEVDLGKPGAHAFQIKGPKGETLGVVDTEWNPETGGLHIADFQSNEGANSLGPGLVRQIRDQLLSLYPEAKSLTGQRITGAVSADRRSGAGPGRVATQVLGQE